MKRFAVRLPLSFWLAVMGVAGVFTALAMTAPVGAFWSPDSGAKYLETVSLRRDHLAWGYGGLVTSLPYGARDVDPDVRLPALPFSFGYQAGPRFQSWFPVWFAALSWLPLHLFGLRGLLALPAIGGIACAALAGALAEGMEPGRGWLAALLTGFATPVMFYSQVFWEHSLAVALALAGVLLAFAGRRWRVAALALVTAAVVLRREMVLAQAALIAWMVWRDSSFRHKATTVAMGLAFLVVGQALWGSRLPLGEWRTVAANLAAPAQGAATPSTGAPSAVPSPSKSLVQPIRRFIGRLEATLYNSPAAQANASPAMAWFTWAAAMLALAGALSGGAWRWPLLAASSLAIVAPVAVNLASPARSLHGLILSAPLLLGCVFGIDRRSRRTVLLGVLVGLSVLAHLAVLDAGPPSGLEWGSRVALLAFPAAAVLLAVQPAPAASRDRWLSGGSLLLLAALGLATQIRGVAMLRSDVAAYARWTAGVEALPRPAEVITDFYFLSSVVTPAFESTKILYVDPAKDRASQLAYAARESAGRAASVTYAGYQRGRALQDWLSPSYNVVSADVRDGLAFARLEPAG